MNKHESVQKAVGKGHRKYQDEIGEVGGKVEGLGQDSEGVSPYELDCKVLEGSGDLRVPIGAGEEHVDVKRCK